jgi:tRNA A37 threonylcarbamoyladenosine modification protein TsaB
MFEVLILPLSKPLLIGVYKNKTLIKTLNSNKQTSEILAKLIKDIFKEFVDIKAFYYANGPGSYLSVKLVYIFISSICIIKKIPFYGALGFYFNDNSPIKAIGSKYFFYVTNKSKNFNIVLNHLDNNKLKPFVLPKVLKSDIFTQNAIPQYELDYLN